MPQCPTCGSDVSEQAVFCPDCGTDLQPGGAPAPPDSAGSAAVSTSGVPAASAPSVGAPEGDVGTPVDAGAAAAPASPLDSGPSLETAAPDAATATAPEAAAAPAPEAAPVPPPAPAAAAGGARLTLKRSGAPTSEVFPIGGRVVLGRFDPETGPVDVDLGNLPESTYVSRQHAEIWQDESGAWRVKDLGSRNGVFVRKGGGGQFQRVTAEETISGGDEIALGNARFEFQTG